MQKMTLTISRKFPTCKNDRSGITPCYGLEGRRVGIQDPLEATLNIIHTEEWCLLRCYAVWLL
jgi:hypothetical protein